MVWASGMREMFLLQGQEEINKSRNKHEQKHLSDIRAELDIQRNQTEKWVL